VEHAFAYDARGRQVAAPDRRVVFTEHDLPKTITTPAGTTSFLYDAEGERVRKSEPKTGGETLSLGGVYERRTSGSSVQHIFSVQGTDGHLAQITYDEATKTESRAYVHPDALGTASAVTDDNKVVTRFDNEPFGKRVQPSGAAFTGDFPSMQVGFTGHSMDDDLGLVNMKGRIYDPSQRRFLSPDPLVSRPLNAQSYNRYSYVYNNPLSFIDPSGFEGTGSGENYCATHPNDPPCAPAPPGGGGPGSGGNWVENPSAGTCGPGTNHPCPTPAPAKARQSVASKFHVVSVPVFDAVVNSDAVTPGRVPVYIDRGSDQTVDVPPPPRFQMARQALMLARVLDPQTDAAIRFAEGIHATVVEPVIDWAADMHTASPGRMRDHSEAMAGALGTVLLTVIAPGEGAAVEAVEGVALAEGELAAAGMQAHHLFPQAAEFAPMWEEAGVNIEHFRVQLSPETHLGQLHSAAGIPHVGPGGLWNATWRVYFAEEAAAGRAITKEGLFRQLGQMTNDFEIPYFSPLAGQ
jgi:RHS repeat-associated protein